MFFCISFVIPCLCLSVCILLQDMHIISTDEKQVFAAVQEWNQNNTYSLYISDSPGVYFILSLENLRTSRGPAGNLLVDFYKVCCQLCSRTAAVSIPLSSPSLITKSCKISVCLPSSDCKLIFFFTVRIFQLAHSIVTQFVNSDFCDFFYRQFLNFCIFQMKLSLFQVCKKQTIIKYKKTPCVYYG